MLLKIRLRPDGTWEHVYNDGSSDQEFYELNPASLAHLQKQKQQLFDMSQDYLELAVEASEYRDAKQIISYIKNKI